MTSTPDILFACNAAVLALTERGDTIRTVELRDGGFRLEGTRAGERLVVAASLASHGGTWVATVEMQVSKTPSPAGRGGSSSLKKRKAAAAADSAAEAIRTAVRALK